MVPQLLRDAWLQYRRRPLAALLVLLVAAAGLPSTLLGDRAGTGPGALLAVGALASFLLNLFLVGYLAGPLRAELPGVVTAIGGGARDAWSAARRSILPGVRAILLTGLYTMGGLLAGMAVAGLTGGLGVLLDPAKGGTAAWVTAAERVQAGSVPFIALATAFLAVLYQPVVLDGQRSVLVAAAVSHRVARHYFPACLLVALLQSVDAVVAYLRLPTGGLIAVTLTLALLGPFVIGISNALYLRVRDAVLPRPAPGTPA